MIFRVCVGGKLNNNNKQTSLNTGKQTISHPKEVYEESEGAGRTWMEIGMKLIVGQTMKILVTNYHNEIMKFKKNLLK